MKKSIYSLFAALALAAGMALGIQGAASAAPEASVISEAVSEDVSVQGWPTGCRHEQTLSHGWRATCSQSNGGSWHVVVVCQPWEGGSTFQRFGPWRDSGWSTAYCPPQTSAQSGFLIERST